jgi:ParB family chromosome partitioning protein
MSAISAEKVKAGAVPEKKDEKLEKRRALGRGLESLLPGPRVVISPELRPGSGADRQASPAPKTDQTAAAAATLSAASETIEGVMPPAPLTPAIGEPASLNDSASRTSGPEVVGATAAGESAAPASLAPAVEEHEVISIKRQAAAQHAVTEVEIELIDKNPYQTRYVFDEPMLRELADSILENGIVQPVVVRPSADAGRYLLVLGERRLRASKIAGLRTIPAIIRRLTSQQAAEMTVLENVQRQDLNPLEQAEAFRVLSKEFHLTQAQIAERIGVSRETVANYMRLLRLPEEVMKYLLEGRLSFSDARAILALNHEDHIRLVAQEVVTRHLKWDQIDERVRELNGFVVMQNPEEGGRPKEGGARWVDPNVRAAQREIEQVLGLRVLIKDKHGKGRIVVEYASLDEYERVVTLLKGNSN